KPHSIHRTLQTSRVSFLGLQSSYVSSMLVAGHLSPERTALSPWTLRLCAIVISFAARSCARRLRILPPPRQWTVATCLQSVCTRSIPPKAARPGGRWARRGPDMPKHKKRHGLGQRTPPPSGPGREAWPSRIESLIARGKSRDAVEAAKHYLKHTPGPEADALAVKAYRARIEALQASGLHREAQALRALVGERLPAHQSQVAVLMRQSEVSAGHFDALLAALVTADAPRRRELEAILARGLTDPAVLTESPVLPADHPLKCMARAVLDAFTAVTT